MFHAWLPRLAAACTVLAGGLATAQDASIFRSDFDESAPAGPCDDPLVSPEGFTLDLTTWPQLLSPRDGAPVPTFPISNGFPVPIGAARFHVVAAEFVAPAGVVSTLYWEAPQANRGEGYGFARPADAMFVGISECPGDFRMKEGFDPCTRFTAMGAINLNTILPGPHPLSCTLQPGKTYYLNVSPHDPVSFQPACRPGDSTREGCDVQARQTSP